MKKKTSTIIISLIFLAGLSLLLYPFISNQWNNYRQGKLISRYETVLAKKEAAGKVHYKSEMEKAQAYNEALLPSILPDSFAVAEATEEEDKRYISCLNITDDGMMGMVEIPKINIKLPLYHTTQKEVLEKAVGHLEGSSLPIGGENTHSVVSAHRGLPSATLFTDLDKLKKGDHFLIHVLDEVLSYEVDQILIVKPEETSALAVEQGKDLMTLLTCTPYGVNSERLLVRGHRVPYEPKVLKDEAGPLGSVSLHSNYLMWVVIGLVVTGGFIFVLYRLEKKKRRTAVEVSTSENVNEITEETTEESKKE